jgi:8-oxo-dGTP pyrophosphatase MutT (NUDIX family)
MRPSSPDPDSPPQVIPRPASNRAGASAPWAALDPAERRGLSVARVIAALDRVGWTGPIPPPAEAAVEVFDGPLPERAVRRAAVLVALFEEAGEARVVLTRRAATLRSHRGEVSFPGGGIDPGEDAVAAATREAFEEVALDPVAVRPVGWLRPVLTFVTNSQVTPVVAVLDQPPDALVPNPTEVERAFDVALADLVADGVFHEERWSVPGRPVPASADGSFPVCFFDLAGETVWGATARMLVELLCVVLDLDPTAI